MFAYSSCVKHYSRSPVSLSPWGICSIKYLQIETKAPMSPITLSKQGFQAAQLTRRGPFSPLLTEKSSPAKGLKE